jgi:hypothetical protein
MEDLLCAVLYLLSRQSRQPQTDLSKEIKEHLQWLSNHPEATQFPVLRKTCDRLALHWQPEEKRNTENELVIRQGAIH